MSEPKTKKLSRRDAIKVLGAAAGASVLANIPAKCRRSPACPCADLQLSPSNSIHVC